MYSLDVVGKQLVFPVKNISSKQQFVVNFSRESLSLLLSTDGRGRQAAVLTTAVFSRDLRPGPAA